MFHAGQVCSKARKRTSVMRHGGNGIQWDLDGSRFKQYLSQMRMSWSTASSPVRFFKIAVFGGLRYKARPRRTLFTAWTMVRWFRPPRVPQLNFFPFALCGPKAHKGADTALAKGGPDPNEVFTMAKQCQVTGKRTLFGHNVSHANNKTKRRFQPNLHERRFWVPSENRWVKLRVSTHALRTIDKNGIEAVLGELRARGEKV